MRLKKLTLLTLAMIFSVVANAQTSSLQTYTYGFSQDMNGWTTIDADGDGNTWYLLNSTSIFGYGGNPGLVTSASYASTALTPDNYLVSPKMKLDGKISFYACGQDAGWPSEHFGVAVSTQTGTNAADFTMLNEWTMTASRQQAPAANAPAGAFKGPRRVQGNWYLYEVDLSSYNGAEGYVAIRHFGCTDWFRLNVDDITLETSQLIDSYNPDYEIVPELVNIPEGAEVIPYYTIDGTLAVYTDNGWADYTKNVKQINVAFIGSDVYLQGLSYYQQGNWVKGTLSGTKITVPSGQYVGCYFINGMTDEGGFIESYTFTIDNEAGTITADGYIAESSSSIENNLISYWITPVFSLTPPVDDRVFPPAGLNTEDWTVARYFYDGQSEIAEEKVIKVGLDGKDVYVHGFSGYSDYIEEGNWIKGTMSDDGKSITFASGQHYGNYNEAYDFYFAVYDPTTGELVPSVTVAYDAEAGTMTWPEDVLILENASKDELNMYGYYTETLAMVRGTAPKPLDAPNITTSEWYFKSKSISTDGQTGEIITSDYTLHVQAAVVNNEVFIKGLCEDVPNGWIKGTLDPSTNKVTFPTGQHIGTYMYWFWTFEYFFAGYGENGMEDVMMDYDAETKTLTMESPGNLIINSSWLLYEPKLVLKDVTLQEILDVATTPALPAIIDHILEGTSYPNITIDVPDTDTEGNPLLSNKLSYQYYYEIDHVASPLTLTTDLYYELTTNMTDIPYDFSDDWDIYPYRLYLNQDFSTWNRIGIQSIYRGGGEENRSEIFWYAISPITFVSANNYTFQSVTVDEVDMTKKINSNKLRGVAEGSTVELSAPKGYRFVSVEAKIDDEHAVEVTTATDGRTASFTMPYEFVNVSYEIERIGYEVTVPAREYITYYNKDALTLEEDDCQLLTITAVGENSVTVSPLTVAAPETPLLVYNGSNEEKTFKLYVADEEETDDVTVYEGFKGTLTDKTFTADEMAASKHYVLNGKRFVHVSSAGTIAANRCWLEVGNATTARQLQIVNGETTGIKNLNDNDNENENENCYYDLQGRRVAQPAKGLYIINGRKVVAK